MAIPGFQSWMLPVLNESAAGEVRISNVVAVLGAKLGLTEAELSELLPSGKQTTFANRVNWAKSYLGKAGLIRLTKRAEAPGAVGGAVASSGAAGASSRSNCRLPDLLHGMRMVGIVPRRLEER